MRTQYPYKKTTSKAAKSLKALAKEALANTILMEHACITMEEDSILVSRPHFRAL